MQPLIFKSSLPTGKMLSVNPILILSEDLAQKLPQRIVELRKAAGLTQATVAERLDITEGRFGHYERGFRRIPVALIPKLAEALECSEADLLGFEQSRAKRGPLSAWEKRVAAIKKLPRDKRQEIQNVVDALIKGA